MERGSRVRRGRPPTQVELTAEQRSQLQRVAAASTSSQRAAIRAKIVLAAALGEATSSIATRLGVSVDAVSHWRRRFAQAGPAALRDRPRSGRKPTVTPIQRCQIVSVACEPGPQGENGLHGWTLDLLKEALEDRGIIRISRSHLHTILERADLKPHKKRLWLHSPDPDFRQKVAQIVELYLNPPPGATVICVDEKTGMQATERKHPDRPARPGQAGRREFEYVRHGTQALIAAFLVHHGDVLTRCGATRTGDDLEAFMEKVAQRVPGTIHVVWDNLNIHHGERWERFNARHQNRFRFHYTPLHASWVNQVELWFGVLQRRCLQNGSFQSVQNLSMAVAAFVAYWNRQAKHPFRWSFTGFSVAAPPKQTQEGERCAQAI
ncbi:MAG TPA: IS630 family transposase [Gemmatimonadales bacterium]|nr:IS630 family transposase [Gemmatimonadales bacterium]